MAETPMPEPDAILTARGHVPAARDAAPPRAGRRSQPAGPDPNAMRKRPTPYELLMRQAREAQTDPNDDGLKTRFAGGTVEISGEAMAQTLASSEPSSADAPVPAAGPATDETTDSDTTESETDSSPSGDTVTPDLGERVL